MISGRRSIASLISAIFMLALGFAALKNASELVASATFSITLLAFGSGSLAIPFREGQRRAFWIGFVSFGLSYLALSFETRVIEPKLITTILLNRLCQSLSPPETIFQLRMSDGDQLTYGTRSKMVSVLSDIQSRWNAGARNLVDPSTLTISSYIDNNLHDAQLANFRLTGHFLSAIGTAFLGGFIARLFHSTRHSADPATLASIHRSNNEAKG